MKRNLALLLLLITIGAFGQELWNKNWYIIKAERKDGSIIPGISYPENMGRYCFRSDTVKNTGPFTITYPNCKVEGNYLTLGVLRKTNFLDIISNNIRFIDFCDDTLLVLSEVEENAEADDKLNRLYYINEEFYFDYLLENQLITFKGDTIIEAEKYFHPRFDGILIEHLNEAIGPLNSEFGLIGQILLSTKGDVLNVQLRSNESVSKSTLELVKKAFILTSGKWELPYPNLYCFNVTFKLEHRFNLMHNYSPDEYIAVYFPFDEQEESLTEARKSVRDIQRAMNYFERANRLMEKQEYKKAVRVYDQCIAVNPEFYDAYFNKAYALYYDGNPNSACKIWKLLQSKGQRAADALVKEYCKE
jgi:tetratricopeptide (TPR) repeat protein